MGKLRRRVHHLLPLYTVFASHCCNSMRKARQLSVVTLIHVTLAVRSSLLDFRPQLTAIESVVPDACCRVHFVQCVDPHSEVPLLLGNIYQAQAL